MNASKMTVTMRVWIISLLLGFLTACGDVQAPAPTVLPPTPTPLAFMPLTDVVRLGKNLTKASIVTVGYLYVDRSGARLTDGVTFSAGETPQPLSPSANQLWLDAEATKSLDSTLRSVGAARLAVVVARGQLEGPGTYGADKQYLYQLNEVQLQALAPQETTLSGLLSNSAGYRNRYVRVTGTLLAQGDAALLVERVSAGGVPEPNARQVKLQSPLRDAALLQQLRVAPDSAVRFGQVQVEAVWRDGVLVPLAIVPIRG